MELAQEGQLVLLGDGSSQRESLVYSTGAWEALRGKVSQALLSYHRQHPLHKGISRRSFEAAWASHRRPYPGC